MYAISDSSSARFQKSQFHDPRSRDPAISDPTIPRSRIPRSRGYLVEKHRDFANAIVRPRGFQIHPIRDSAVRESTSAQSPLTRDLASPRLDCLARIHQPVAELCRRHVPPLDPQSSDDAAFLARYESLLPKGGQKTARGFGDEGLPPTATVASGYLAEGGPDERARWAECYTQYHRFMKQNTGLLHECMENCWQYVQKGDLRLCRHLFNCLTRLRMPLVTVAVTLRTPEEKRALLFPGEFPAMSKNNPNGFALNMDLAVERCHYKVLKQRKWQLRPRMFLAKVGGELVEPVGEEETFHDWHARAVAQLNRVVDATAEVLSGGGDERGAGARPARAGLPAQAGQPLALSLPSQTSRLPAMILELNEEQRAVREPARHRRAGDLLRVAP